MQTTFILSLFAARSADVANDVKANSTDPVELDAQALSQVAGGVGPAGTWATSSSAQGPAGTW